MDILIVIYLGFLGLGLLIALIFYPVWYFSHQLLCQKLDSLLFREPYFKESELRNYQFYPLCALKSGNYMYLIALPKLAKLRRFRNFEGELPVSTGLRIVSKLFIYTGVLGTVTGVAFFAFNAYILVAM